MEKDTIPTHHAPSRQLSTKKHGFLSTLKIILYMLRRRSAKKTHVDVASKGLWRRLVGAMRPLHHQHLPQRSSPPPSLLVPPIPKAYSFHDVAAAAAAAAPMSPQELYSPASSSTSDGTKSRYASALNLQELDKSDEGENIEVVIEEAYYEDGGDEMIDAKAEEFIANFYQQMRLQRLESMHRYNIETIQNNESSYEG